MKAFKPQRLGMLQRVVEHERRCTMVVTVFVYAPLSNPRAVLPDQSMWLELADLLPWGLLDEGCPKPRGEVLVTGSAFAPGGVPVGATMAGLELRRGDRPLVHKRLAVFGTRHWAGSSPTDPVPFTRQAIDYPSAFGGEGFEKNPVGKGLGPIDSEHGPVHPLPHVEDPRRLITSKRERPDPAGFGPYPLHWPQRFGLVGKRYDNKWLKTRFPGPAEDFDAHFYNTAPPDQQFDGFLRGDEVFVLEGMHPDQPRISGQLVPLRVRAFVTQRIGEGVGGAPPEQVFKAIETRLDTVHFFPHIERVVCVYRGTLSVADDEGDDIVDLMIAAEDPDHPKPLEHYQDVLRRRLDKDDAALESLNDADLMPPTDKGWSARIDGGQIGALVQPENLKLKNAERGLDKKLAETKAALAAAGMANDEAFDRPEMPPLPDDPYDVEAVLELTRAAAKLGAELQEKVKGLEATEAAMKDEARLRYAEAGFDYDADMEKANASVEEAVDYSADDHFQMLQNMARIAAEAGIPNESLERDLADPRYKAQLDELETMVRANLKRMAHLLPFSTTVDGDRAEGLRVLVQAAKDGGESLAGRRLKGARLAGLDLRGMDLSGTMLVGADLTDADLSDSNLSDAILARATLTRTNFTNADLSRTNIGGSRLDATNFTNARLDETVFMRSVLDGALFHGARMVSPDFIETEFLGADFSYAQMETPLFLQADLRRVTFTGVSMVLGRFLEVDVRDVDFTGADLPKAQFSCAQGDGARFAGANMENAFLVYKSSFVGCDFAGANLNKANLSGTPLERCNFDGATLNAAALIKCDLRGATMHRIVGRQLLAMRADLRGVNLRGADLLGAILQKANLRGTDLTGANLSRADLSLVRKDSATSLREALMLDTRTDPEHVEPRASGAAPR